MQQPEGQAFGIAEARRVLGDVFAPWVRDLDLSVEAFDFEPSADARDWQPGAILRMPFSEKLCRNGGMVCGQALMAFADTAMVIANLAANRGYRPMTTVDQTTHFMRAVMSSDVLADAGGDGLERVRDAVLKIKPTPFGMGLDRNPSNKTNDRRADYLPRISSAALTMLIEGLAPQ
jgi:hypothetical protein